MTSEQVKEYITNLAKEIAENRTFSSSSSMNKGKMSKTALVNRLLADEKIDLYEVTSSAPKSIKVDGKEFKVILEVANENKLNSFAKGNSASAVECGVGVDDQYFWDGVSSEVTVPVQLVYKESASKPAETVYWTLPYASDIDDIDEHFNAAIDEKLSELDYPMFVLTIENTVDEFTIDKMNKTNNPGPYLAYKGVRLKVERDGWTDEEFELWYSKTDGVYNNYGCKYHWKFNGHTRPDASGVLRYFNDVNKKNKWYERPDDQLIRLMALNSTPHFMVPWEDDWNSGDIDRYPDYIDPNGVPWEAKLYDAYNCATNRVDAGVIIRTHVDHLGALDQDDRYSEAGIYNITAGNVHARAYGGNIFFETNQAINGGLDDINYRLTYRAQ